MVQDHLPRLQQNVANLPSTSAPVPRAIAAAPPPRAPTLNISPIAAAYLASSAEMFAPKRPRFPLSLPINPTSKLVGLEVPPDATSEVNQLSSEIVPAEEVEPNVIVEGETIDVDPMASDEAEGNRQQEASVTSPTPKR